ncbi:MAG: zinc-binding dehydrogenase, partial [Desulfosarcina sp.]
LKVPETLSDEQVLFLSDIFPTGFQAAENCNIRSGDTIAVWGCGPVGQFAIQSAWLLGAERVIAIDRIAERLEIAHDQGKAEVIDYSDDDAVFDRLQEITGGRGPDACIDAVGMEAHGFGMMGWFDKAMQTVKMQTDRPTAFRQAVQSCRKGGTVSIPGVYGGVVDKINLGAAFGKGLTFRMGQTHVQRYLPKLLHEIEEKHIDPTFVISHRLALEKGPEAYEIFKKKQDNCTKIVLRP